MGWEYKTFRISGYLDENELEQRLNDLGTEGWELVNIIPQISSNYDSSYGDIDLNINCCEEVYIDFNIAVLKRRTRESDK